MLCSRETVYCCHVCPISNLSYDCIMVWHDLFALSLEEPGPLQLIPRTTKNFFKTKKTECYISQQGIRKHFFIATVLTHVTATLVLRLFYCVPLINRYVKYRDLSRAIKAHPSPRLSEVSDSGAFGGAGCFVVPVDSLPLELGVIDFIVVRYILVLFDPVVSLRVLVELFEGAACVSVVVLVLAGCVVFSVDGIGLSVVVRLVW